MEEFLRNKERNVRRQSPGCELLCGGSVLNWIFSTILEGQVSKLHEGLAFFEVFSDVKTAIANKAESRLDASRPQLSIGIAILPDVTLKGCGLDHA
jgi:hypothetical protein